MVQILFKSYMMKKILLLIVTVFMVSWLFSQSLELYFEGELMDPMAEITLTAHPDSGMMIIDTLDVKNISNATLDIICVREIVENIEGTVNTFCWGGQCYPPFVDTSSTPTTIAPQAISIEFSGDHAPNGFVGVTKVKYTFYDMANPDDNAIIFVNYDASETISIDDNNEHLILSKAYPNPANNIVSVDYQVEKNAGAHVAIFNLLGSKIKEIALTESFGTLTINTSDFVEGIYFYSLLVNNEASQTQKLIIKH